VGSLECLSSRIKDIDFNRAVIVMRGGTGNKDRMVMLPAAQRQELRAQIAAARGAWAGDRATDRPGVALPYASQGKFPTPARRGLVLAAAGARRVGRL